MNLCSSRAVNSLTVQRRPGDGVVHPFPAGLRVLVVDDDVICLTVLQRMLQKCLYEVTIHNRAEAALELLRKDKTGFDIVLSDVHMPDMDGFKLLECVGLEMDLPVIMMSADESKDVVMKGVTHGACDYLIKPIRIEALKNIWQHVVRKKKQNRKEIEFEQPGTEEDGEQQQNPVEDADYLSSPYEENRKNSNKRKDEKDEAEEMDDTSTLKKPRVVWSVELHQQFVNAVNQLDIDKAVPKKILELMNVPGLTRENVASHLQKYRLYLRRISGVSQQQNGFNSSFRGPPDVTFGSISSLNGLSLQALAASGQIPPQSLAAIQAAALGIVANKSAISVPLIDQRNVFGYENQKLRFGEGYQQLNNNRKQMKLLHGIPTNMEPKQLATLHQSAEAFGNMQVQSQSSESGSLMTQLAQPLSSNQILNEINGSHVSGLSSSFGQPTLSQPNPSGVLTRSEIDNVCGAVYSSVSHPSVTVDFSVNPCTQLPGNRFAPVSNSKMSTLVSKGILQEEAKSDTKGSRGFLSNYGVFSNLNQNRTPDWGLHNVGPAFEPTQHSNMNQQLNSLLADNTHCKAKKFPDMGFQNNLFPEQFDQEDLLSSILKEEGTGPVESEFSFDGYHLDNLPV
ncbi:two-component response regulator ARR2-like isoform X2 [Olea europaea var. sylvestris]|uniref:two-component response regulator ARR2-like isoform X2 n=1 Tax=Olea europaea var. sylvestris TaxID=158386 RepID=UPI000C1D11D5|nr:two-component response regulator ARR2-like isoform X2 [Olea europaea var. sylvestris]